LAEILASIGLEVTTASSPASVERILKDSNVRFHPFGLVLVDSDQPVEVCARLRELPETSPTHLAVLTANGRRGDGARCRELRVAAYLTEPVGSLDIAEALKQVLMGPAPDDLTVLVTRHWLRERRHRLGVLVVDDSPTHRMNMTRLFERRGHRVMTVDSGEAAIEELERHDFDVVVMDIVMPGIGGVEAIRRLRSRWPDADTRVVAVTSEEDTGLHEEIRVAGADTLLRRPFESTDLFNVIDDLTSIPA
jgi:CheY-like chemotaxis protein